MNRPLSFRLAWMLLGLSIILYTQPAHSLILSINTDANWKSYDRYQAGWNTVGFDDSLWRDAYAGYSLHPDDTAFPHLVNADTIWDWPYDTIPTGSNGPLKAFFRFQLTLDEVIETAFFSYTVDDALILYINGVNAYSHSGAGNTNTADYHAIDQSLFSMGSNIIAIEAWDGSSSTVWDRGGESLTAHMLLDQRAVPEPGLLWLFVAGAMGLLIQPMRRG